MRLDDVQQVVDIHRSSWKKAEISVKLGSNFLKAFYENVVESPYSFGFVAVDNHRILSYATGFYGYSAFNNFLKRKIFLKLILILLIKLLSLKMSLADMLNLLNDGKKLRKAHFPRHHLGALALANEVKRTDRGKVAITLTINAVLDEFKRKGYPGCSGVCDDENMPMKNYFLKLGFEKIDTIKFIGKNVVLFEKTFEVSQSQDGNRDIKIFSG
jgi:hypothetical protein